MSKDFTNNLNLPEQIRELKNCLNGVRSNLKILADSTTRPPNTEKLLADLESFSSSLAIFLATEKLTEDRDKAEFDISLKNLHRFNTTNSQNFDRLCTDYLQTGCQTFGLETGIIGKVIGDKYMIVAVNSNLKTLKPKLEFDWQDTHCERVIEEVRTITHTDVGKIEKMRNHPVARNLKLKSYIGTPILINGELYGTLNFSSTKIRKSQFSDREIETLELMAENISKYLVIERKEKALQESETRFCELADSAPIMIWMSDISGECTFLNRTWLEFTGKSLQEQIGYGWLESIHERDRVFCIDSYLRAFKKRLPFEIEYRLKRKDGQYRWILEKGIPRFTSAENFIGYIGSSLDITESKQNLAQLQRQHRRAQMFQEVSHKIRQCLQLKEILTTTVNETRKLLHVDRVLIVRFLKDCPILVAESECNNCYQLKGKTILDALIKNDYLDEYRQGIIVAISDFDKALEPLEKQTKPQYLGIKASAIAPIFTGEKLWGLLSIQQCKTTRKWQEFDIQLVKELADRVGIAISFAELLEKLEDLVQQRTAQLSKTNQKLQQQIAERASAEQQLRIITDSIPALIAYVDDRQRYRFNNKAYEEWFNIPITKIKGQKISQILGEKYYLKIKKSIERALCGERVSQDNIIVDRNGKSRWINATYIPDFTKNGRVKGFFALIIDITERKAIETMKNEFISLVSHELRTPLASIHGSLKLLATGRLGNLSLEGQQMLNIADSNTDRLVRLVSDILDLQRMESGKVRIEKLVCHADRLIQQAIDATIALASSQQITLVNNATNLSFWADPDYILQVLTNLIGNAIKFSHPHSLVSIDALPYQQQTCVLFSVRDTGRGIPTDKLETIFERFNQVDASDRRSKGGTGLGLAICRTIVELHDGKIWAESAIGSGSTFYFTIPLGNCEPAYSNFNY